MQELLLLVTVFFAFKFLILGFEVKSWPLPLVAALLFVFAGYAAMNVQNVFCTEVVGSLQCITRSTFNTELVVIMGAMALFSMVVGVLRIMQANEEQHEEVT